MENSVLIGSALNLPLQHLNEMEEKTHLVEKAFLVDSGTNKDTHPFFFCVQTNHILNNSTRLHSFILSEYFHIQFGNKVF